jgi:rod shape-determining protein MreD
MPDFLAVVLVFWGMHQPRRVGMGAAFVFGLCMDAPGRAPGPARAGLPVLIYFAIMLHRRILWFRCQARQLLPLFAAAHAITIVLRLIGGGAAGWTLLLAPVLEAALWWPVSVLLLAPSAARLTWMRTGLEFSVHRRWPAYNKRDADNL